MLNAYLLINLFDDTIKKNTSTLRPNFDAFTLATRGLEDLFSSCAVVSVFCSGGK
jgi:hypothetical protein